MYGIHQVNHNVAAAKNLPELVINGIDLKSQIEASALILIDQFAVKELSEVNVRHAPKDLKNQLVEQLDQQLRVGKNQIVRMPKNLVAVKILAPSAQPEANAQFVVNVANVRFVVNVANVRFVVNAPNAQFAKNTANVRHVVLPEPKDLNRNVQFVQVAMIAMMMVKFLNRLSELKLLKYSSRLTYPLGQNLV
jgi:hypothetical protein